MSASVDPPPRTAGSLLSQYWKVLVIFSPLITFSVSLAMSPRGMFWQYFRMAMTISVVTASTSFAVIAAMVAFDRRRARGGKAHRVSRGRLWYLAWSFASMPLGLLASAEVTSSGFWRSRTLQHRRLPLWYSGRHRHQRGLLPLVRAA